MDKDCLYAPLKKKCMDIKMNLKDAVFLLGGHDLEMLEISKMLSSKGIFSKYWKGLLVKYIQSN